MYCKNENVCNEIATNVSSISKYYFNNDDNKDKKPIIKCSKSTCQTIAAPTGYIINGHNNDLIFCESTTSCKSIERSTLATYQFYLNGGDDKSSKPLIKCNYNGCATTVASIGYYLDGEYNLIYCESKTLCSKVTENNSSTLTYYLSNGNNGIKPLIKCVEGKCNMIEASTGYYLNGANNNIIHCVNPSMCSEGDINTTTISKYYLNKGDDRKSNPLIDCNNSACSTIQASICHYLNSDNDNVIYCESSKSCKDVNETRSNIFYLNKGGDMKSKPLIKCVDGTCITSKASSRYFVIGTNNVVKCTSTTACTEVAKNTSSIPSYYLNSGSDKKLKPLIKCVNGTCATINIAKGYYLNSANNGLINCLTTTTCSKVTQIPEFKYYLNNGDDTNLLITCTNNVCSTLTASVGYYIDGSNDNLIYCNNPYACSKMAKNTSSVSKYYINNGGDKDSKPLIDCINSTCTTTTASKGYYVDGAKDLIYCENDSVYNKMMKNTSSLSKHYLNAGGDKASNRMIKCIKTGCTTIPAVAGYYLDGENRLINCESSTVCNEVSINTSATPELYTDNGSDRDPKSLIKCVNGTCKILSSIGYHLDEAKDLFYCTNINTCEKVDNILQVDVVRLKHPPDTTKTTCSKGEENNTSISKYYFNNGDDKKPLIECTSNTCITTSTTSGGYISGVNNNVIYCKNDMECAEESLIESTTISKYYVNNGSNKNDTPLIICTADGCQFSTASIGGYINGQQDQGDAIYCENTTSCTEANLNGEYYYLNKNNDSNDYPLIKCNDRICSTTTASSGYYTDGASSLIYCSSDVKCSIKSIPSKSTYYLNNGEDSSLIECVVDGGCSSKDAAIGYYISEVNNKLIYCGYNNNANNCDITNTITSNPNYYENSGEDKSRKPLIKCNSEGCTTIEVITGYYIKSINKSVIYCNTNDNTWDCQQVSNTTGNNYISNGEDKNSKPIIMCTSSGCTNPEVDTSSTKYYVNGTGENPLIQCNSNGCTTSTASIGGYISGTGLVYCESTTKCKEISSGFSGKYYLNGSEDKDTNQLIKCDSTCEIIASSTFVNCYGGDLPEFYKNGYNSSQLIKCIHGSCEIYSNVQSGAYINNKHLIIYCKKSGNNVTCNEVNTYYSDDYPHYFLNASGIGGALIKYDKRSMYLSIYIDICFINPDATEYANYGSNTSKIICNTTSNTCQESN